MRLPYTRRAIWLALPILAASPLLPAQQAIPEAPSIWREVAGVVDLSLTLNTPDPVFTRPHMPGWRTTQDGRVGLRVENPTAASPNFGLMKPELMTAPFLSNSVTIATAGTPTMYESNLVRGLQTAGGKPIDWDGFIDWRTSHFCLWDDGVVQGNGTKDTYHVKVVVTSTEIGSPNPPGIRVVTTPVEIVVADAKTPNAYIESAIQDGPQTFSPIWMGPTPGNPSVLKPFEGFGFEPAIACDGRLLVLRVGSSDFTFRDPNTGAPNDLERNMDIVYAWSEVAGDPANAENWDQVYPITVAPFDNRINQTVGLALAPFRDAKGNLIHDPTAVDVAYDIGGSYPWVDREGDNLFMETVRDTLATDHPTLGPVHLLFTGMGRYFYERVQIPGFGPDPLAIEGQENRGKHQAISVAGKWTHGKVVQIDTLNNDMDFAVGENGLPDPATNNLGPQRRLVSLFQPNSLPATTVIPPFLTNPLSDPQAGKTLFSYGRSTVYMPLGENDNANIIDSIENKLNYRRDILPPAYRDIVWFMNNSKQSDQHVFDDSLDPDALIVANMTGALEYDSTNFVGGVPQFFPRFKHHTGWDGSGFTETPEVQNAATALPDRWTVPTHGEVLGDGRIEPAAVGGIYGKGFWMDGAIGLRFAFPAQSGSQSLSGQEWYVGLFVDSRFPDDTTERRLLRFPNGGELRLRGRHQLLISDAAGSVEHRAAVPAPLGTSSVFNDLLPEGGWAHVALQLRNGGRDVEILLNGLPLSRWTSNEEPLLDFAPGDLIVGAGVGQSDGFVGWVDELKVFAHTVDPETACNHAGGTLVGMTSAHAGILRTDIADRYPDWAHEAISEVVEGRGETPQDAYANFFNYRKDNSNGPDLLELFLTVFPGELSPMRPAVHFPEGPLFHDAPRPFSGDNGFCLSCHHSNAESGLGLGALAYLPGTNAVDDSRRQPLQPPARLHGVIPANLVDAGPTPQPASSTVAPPSGQLIDEWLLANWPGAASVENFTLLDASSSDELDVLPPGISPVHRLDPAILGADDLFIRINLDSSIGDVDVLLTGVGGNPPAFTAQQATLSAPYHFPVDLTVLNAAMEFTLTATPVGGSGKTIKFDLPDRAAGARVVASYGADFQESSPRASWLYGWNAYGDPDQVASFRSLNWFAPASRYTDLGLGVPEPTPLQFGHLRADGGHPGAPTPHEGFVMAGYRAKYPGYYKIDNGTVDVTTAPTNGVEVGVLVQSGATMMTLIDPAGTGDPNHAFATTSLQLQTGDILWVVIGPNGSSANDRFDMDFDVVFDETSF